MSTISPGQSERLTRKSLIDPKLTSAGWRIVPFNAAKPLSACNRCAIEEYPTSAGPADYALCVDGKILGVVEAKKLSLGPQNVLTQAERYSKGLPAGLNFRGYHSPFLYSTNGEIIWFHDIRNALSRSHTVSAFHTPEALLEKLDRNLDAACQRLVETPNDHPKLRPYQRDANAAVEQAIAQEKSE